MSGEWNLIYYEIWWSSILNQEQSSYANEGLHLHLINLQGFIILVLKGFSGIRTVPKLWCWKISEVCEKLKKSPNDSEAQKILMLKGFYGSPILKLKEF